MPHNYRHIQHGAELREIIVELLHQKPHSVKELCSRIIEKRTDKGVSRPTITNALKRLQARSLGFALSKKREYDDESQRFCYRYSVNEDFYKEFDGTDEDRYYVSMNKWEARRFKKS